MSVYVRLDKNKSCIRITVWGVVEMAKTYGLGKAASSSKALTKGEWIGTLSW